MPGVPWGECRGGRCGGPGALLPPQALSWVRATLLGTVPVHGDPLSPHPRQGAGGARRGPCLGLFGDLGLFWGLRALGSVCHRGVDVSAASFSSSSSALFQRRKASTWRRRAAPTSTAAATTEASCPKGIAAAGWPAGARWTPPVFYLLYFSCTSRPRCPKGAWPQGLAPFPGLGVQSCVGLEGSCGVRSCGVAAPRPHTRRSCIPEPQQQPLTYSLEPAPDSLQII